MGARQPVHGGFSGRPETELVRPLRGGQSHSGVRPLIPFEPWAEGIRTLLLVYGVLLIACFVAPWAVGDGGTTFSWTLIKAPGAAAKLTPLLIVSTGLFAVAIGAIPMPPVPRGWVCMLIGLGPLVALNTVPSFSWRAMLGLVGAALLVGGLLIRSRYTDASLGRLLATVGVLMVLAVYLIPEGGQVPLVGTFKLLGSAPGKGKVAAIIGGGMGSGVLPIVVVLLALLVWLPGPSRAGSSWLAWILILYPVIASLTLLIIGGNMLGTLKASLAQVVYIPTAISAWLAFSGYGLATVTGKSLEGY